MAERTWPVHFATSLAYRDATRAKSDRLFHLRVAELTGNSVLSGLVDGLWARMLVPMFDVLGRHAGPRAIVDHERIVEALGRCDAEAARAAMRAHPAHVEEILMREDMEDAETPRKRGSRAAAPSASSVRKGER